MSAFVLLFALVATIGSTYAWFTISDTVTVQSVDLTVTSEDSLLIRVWDTGDPAEGATSWTADNFSNVITQSDITGTTQYAVFASYLLTPVTAANTPLQSGGTDYTLLDSDSLGTISISSPADRTISPATANVTSEDSPTSGYIELKFWLMSQATPAAVRLQTLTTSTSTGASQALYVGTKATTDAIEKIYPVDSDWGFSFADSTVPGWIAQDTSHDNADETTFWNSVPTGQNTGTGDFGRLELQSLESAPAGTATADTVINLAADTPEILTVRIWIEGWDAEATNAIMSDTFTLTLAFQIFEPAA